jgi:hypothetical protein
MLDLSLGFYAVGFVAGVVFPSLTKMALSAGRGGEVLLALVSMPFVMILDASVLALFGNTLGRLIVGIRVETIEHAKPPLTACLQRNGLIYVFGLGLGIPVVNLFTLIGSFTEVNEGRLARWDAKLGARVYDRGGAITAGLYIAVGALPNVLSAIQAAAR